MSLLVVTIVVLIMAIVLKYLMRERPVFTHNDIILDNTGSKYPELYINVDKVIPVADEAESFEYLQSNGFREAKLFYKGMWDEKALAVKEAYGHLPVSYARYIHLPPKASTKPKPTGTGYHHYLVLSERSDSGIVKIWVEGRVPPSDENRYYAGIRILKHLDWITFDASQPNAIMNTSDQNIYILELSVD